MTGLSRRRSRVRVPSLPSLNFPANRHWVGKRPAPGAGTRCVAPKLGGMERAEAEAIFDGDRETAVVLYPNLSLERGTKSMKRGIEERGGRRGRPFAASPYAIRVPALEVTASTAATAWLRRGSSS
jgi:hypothetical protein